MFLESPVVFSCSLWFWVLGGWLNSPSVRRRKRHVGHFYSSFIFRCQTSVVMKIHIQPHRLLPPHAGPHLAVGCISFLHLELVKVNQLVVLVSLEQTGSVEESAGILDDGVRSQILDMWIQNLIPICLSVSHLWLEHTCSTWISEPEWSPAAGCCLFCGPDDNIQDFFVSRDAVWNKSRAINKSKNTFSNPNL